MAKAAPKKKAKSAKPEKVAPKAFKRPEPVGRTMAVESRRQAGTVSVLVQTKPAVAIPRPPPVALPAVKLLGSPLDISRQFFDAHQLPTLAAALPSQVDTTEFVAAATKQGLNRVLVMPPVKKQRSAFEAMVQQLLAAPSPALTLMQQYTTPWLADVRELWKSETRGRPEGAYLLAIADGAYPDDTRDRKAAQLEGRFAALGTNSLTVTEYFVLQRLFAEEYQDHRFDQAIAARGLPSGWQWLLDSRSSRGGIHVWWNSDKRRVEVGFSPAGHFDSKRGAHPTLIHPL